MAQAARALVEADEAIDGPLHQCLADGTIRLLSCAWLMTNQANDIHLGQDADGRPFMRRM